MDLNEANLEMAIKQLKRDDLLSNLIADQDKIIEFINSIAERVVKLENDIASALDLLRQLHDCSGIKNFPGALKFKEAKDES